MDNIEDVFEDVAARALNAARDATNVEEQILMLQERSRLSEENKASLWAIVEDDNLSTALDELEEEVVALSNENIREQVYRVMECQRRADECIASLNELEFKIQSLVYNACKLNNIQLDQDLPDSCCFCLSAMKATESVGQCNECQRYFHSDCVSTWLKDQKSCPLCRKYTVM